jgi:hypothetical protein
MTLESGKIILVQAMFRVPAGQNPEQLAQAIAMQGLTVNWLYTEMMYNKSCVVLDEAEVVKQQAKSGLKLQ